MPFRFWCRQAWGFNAGLSGWLAFLLMVPVWARALALAISLAPAIPSGKIGLPLALAVVVGAPALVSAMIALLVYALRRGFFALSGRPDKILVRLQSGRDSTSVLRKRLKKFRSLKRGYYAFIVLLGAYVLSYSLPFIMSSRALVVKYKGAYHFPTQTFYQGEQFGQFHELALFGKGPANYRLLSARLEAEGKGDWALMPLVPYGPNETDKSIKEKTFLEAYAKGDFSVDAPAEDKPKDDDEGYAGDDDDEGYGGDDDEGYGGDDEELMVDEDDEKATAAMIKASFPYAPSDTHWLGTDAVGRDLLVRLAYGFKVSITFALLLLVVSYALGLTLGSVLGYFGGKVDLLGLRLIEIWQTVPFLFTVMILGAGLREVIVVRPELPDFLQPSFVLLVCILAAFSWMSISYYVRGEFLREKSRDYVSAAISIGVPDRTIIFKHILPNALTPVVTFAPFALVAYISSLVALDYLGFGLLPPTPSWGELMKQALPAYLQIAPWLAISPIVAMFLTLLLVVFIGEAVREAFDPKVFSRLR